MYRPWLASDTSRAMRLIFMYEQFKLKKITKYQAVFECQSNQILTTKIYLLLSLKFVSTFKKGNLDWLND